MEHLSSLERAVLLAIVEQTPEYADALRAQLSSASVVERENTGVGFFTKFAVGSAPTLDGAASPLGDIGAELQGVQLGMGFLLWLEDGVMNTLEGYTYGDEATKGVDLVNVTFSSVGPRAR